MRRIIHHIFLLIICVSTISLHAQISISFNPVINGQSIEGLRYVQIINSAQEDVKASITIRVTEQSKGSVLIMILHAVPLARGVNFINAPSFSSGKISFYNNSTAQLISQTGKFPEGEYEYCYEVEITDSKTQWTPSFFENCFSQSISPMTPLLLINPPDEEKDCNTRPSFLWQLPFPLPAGSQSRLVLTELKEEQDPADAINFNIPILNEGAIPGNQLQYPSSAPALKDTKKYAWQVIVYYGKTILKRSEIWIYEVKCTEMIKAPADDGYREINVGEDGNYYVTEQLLRFSFNNSYNGGPLNYSISPTASPAQFIKGLPELKMQPGLNKFDIDLSEIRDFKRGQEYTLKIFLNNNTVLKLRFIYKDATQ